MNNDPPTCVSCRYFEPKWPDDFDGSCHRYPPTPMFVGHGHEVGVVIRSYYADTTELGWCGEHRTGS